MKTKYSAITAHVTGKLIFLNVDNYQNGEEQEIGQIINGLFFATDPTFPMNLNRLSEIQEILKRNLTN